MMTNPNTTTADRPSWSGAIPLRVMLIAEAAERFYKAREDALFELSPGTTSERSNKAWDDLRWALALKGDGEKFVAEHRLNAAIQVNDKFQARLNLESDLRQSLKRDIAVLSADRDEWRAAARKLKIELAVTREQLEREWRRRGVSAMDS